MNRQFPKPKVPSMRLEKRRLASFTHIQWPFKDKLSPQNLAACGFFYDGLGDDFVRCFHCQVVLGNWNEQSDPWIEHALQSENCFYLKCRKISRPEKRTSRFWNNQASRTQASRTQTSSSRTQASTSRNNQARTQASTSRNNQARTISQASTSARFEYRPPTPGYTSPDRPPSPDYPPPEYSQPSARRQGYSPMSPVRRPPSPDYSPPLEYSPMSPVRPPTPDYSPPVITTLWDDLEYASMSPIPDSPTFNYDDLDYAPMSPVYSPPFDPPEPDSPFKPSTDPASPVDMSCKICLENPMNIILQPCRHLLMCDECAYKVSECPICRQSIRQRISAILC